MLTKNLEDFLFQKVSFSHYLQARTIYAQNYTSQYTPFPKIPLEEEEAILRFFAKNGLELELIKKTNYLDHLNWWYKMEPVNEEDVSFYLPLLVLELSLYPPSLWKRLSIRKFTLCHSLVFHTDQYEQYRAGLLDNQEFTLIFSGKERDVNYIRRVIHHEFFHHIDHTINGTFYYQDPEWEAFNPVGFEYGEGGQVKRVLLSLDMNLKSFFFNDYCTSGIEEDKAETFAWLVTEGKSISSLSDCESLYEKCIYIKNMLMLFDKSSFWQGTNDFWDKAIQYKKQIVNQYLL